MDVPPPLFLELCPSLPHTRHGLMPLTRCMREGGSGGKRGGALPSPPQVPLQWSGVGTRGWGGERRRAEGGRRVQMARTRHLPGARAQLPVPRVSRRRSGGWGTPRQMAWRPPVAGAESAAGGGGIEESVLMKWERSLGRRGGGEGGR